MVTASDQKTPPARTAPTDWRSFVVGVFASLSAWVIESLFLGLALTICRGIVIVFWFLFGLAAWHWFLSLPGRSRLRKALVLLGAAILVSILSMLFLVVCPTCFVGPCDCAEARVSGLEFNLDAGRLKYSTAGDITLRPADLYKRSNLSGRAVLSV